MKVCFRSACFPAAAGLLAACGQSSPGAAGSGATTRDSAGIAIVANAGATWPAGKGWTISESPSLDIGGGGTQDTDVSQVTGAVRLGDGRVAIASGSSNVVRFYDATGKLVTSAGRVGAGPGEFRGLTGLWRGAGDSVVAFDVMLLRLTVLDQTGAFGRNLSLGGQTGLQAAPANGRFGMVIPVGVGGDGSVVGMGIAINLQQQQAEGSVRDSVALIRFGPDGVARDTVGRFLGVEMSRATLSFGGREMSMPSPVPLGRQTVVGVGADRVFVAQNTAWEVESRSPSGKLERLIRVDAAPLPLTEADVAVNRKEQIALMEAQPQMRGIPQQLKDQFVARANQVKYPAVAPWIAGLFPVSDGHLWVEEVVKPGTERRQFAVLDRDGTFLGRVSAPPKLRVLAVYPDAVLGVWKDEDDIEHVRIHQIVR